MNRKKNFRTSNWFLAIPFAILQFWGIKDSVFKSTQYNWMPILNFSDSSLYLSQLKSIIDSESPFKLWYVSEHAQTAGSLAANPIYLFWGLIGRALSLELFHTYLIMISITSFLTWHAIEFLIKKTTRIQRNLLLTTTGVAVIGVGFNLGRPSPTQLTLWLLLIGLGYASYPLQNIVKINIIGVILVISNPSYAILYISYLILNFTFSSRWIIQTIWKFSPISITMLCYSLYLSSYSSSDSKRRFGLLETHLPGALRISSFIIILILLIFCLKRFSKVDWNKNILRLLISLLCALNSQVITGKLFETESHLRYAINVIFLLSIYDLFSKYNDTNLKNRVFVYFSISIILLSINNSISHKKDWRNFTTREISLLKRIQQNQFLDKTFLIKQDSYQRDFYSFLPLNSKIHLYWHPDLVFFDIDSSEIIARFGCTVSNQYSFSDFESDKGLIYGHKYENLKQFYSKYYWISQDYPNKFVEMEGIKLKKDYLKIIYWRNQCQQGKYIDHVDFSITDGEITRLRRQ